MINTMQSMQLKDHEMQTRIKLKVILTTVRVKVKFACRFFMEYRQGKLSKRTKQILIDSNKQLYQYNQEINWKSCYDDLLIQKKDPLTIMVKLLSKTGMEFTVGAITIYAKDFSQHNGPVSYLVSKTTDIVVECWCRFEKSKQQEAKEESVDQIKQQICENSRMKMELVNSQNDVMENMVLSATFNGQIMVDKNGVGNDSSMNSDLCSRKVSSKYINQGLNYSPTYQKSSHNKICQLQREHNGYCQLYQRQKQIIVLLENKHRESNSEQERLKKILYKYELELEKKRQKISDLEEERIQLLRKGIEHEKQIANFQSSLRKLLQQTEKQINYTFSLRHQKKGMKPQYKKSHSIAKNPQSGVKTPIILVHKQKQIIQSEENSYSSQGEPQSLAALNKIFKGQLEQSIVIKHSQNERILQKKQKKSRSRNSQSSQLVDCLEMLNKYFSKLSKDTIKHSKEIEVKLINLGESNSKYRQILNRNREEFQNCEESLISYIEELDEELKRQRQLTQQKEKTISKYIYIIEDLSEKIAQNNAKIKQLQDINEKLQEQKECIKTQLHENNYIYAVKEDEFMKKIQYLQGRFSSQIPHKFNAPVDQSQSHQPEIEHIGIPDPHRMLNQYCQRLRDMEMELLSQKKQRQRLLDQLQHKQEELRFALLQRKKLQFTMKLKYKIPNSQNEYDKSYEVEDESKNELKCSFNQQEVLKVLT